MTEIIKPRSDWDCVDHYYPDGLVFDGCACAEGVVASTYIVAHCHRTNRDCDCAYAGVHYRGDAKVARMVADYIANAYRCDVTLVELDD